MKQLNAIRTWPGYAIRKCGVWCAWQVTGHIAALSLVVMVAIGLSGCAGSTKHDDTQARVVTAEDFVGPADGSHGSQVGMNDGRTRDGQSGAAGADEAGVSHDADVVAVKAKKPEVRDDLVLTPIRPRVAVDNMRHSPSDEDGNAAHDGTSDRHGMASDEGVGARGEQDALEAGNGTEDYVVDAMVGQINGRALYAGAVLGVMDEQLTALGKNVSGREFDRLAMELIAARLRGMILDQLILGEAERDLNENERMGLRFMLKEERGKMLRLYGQGSPELADRTLQDRTGKGLEETLREFRQQVVVERYMRQKFWPKVNVLRKDVERAYKERHEEFNPQASWTIHLIRVKVGADANRIEARLQAGEDFLTVAKDPGNRMRLKEEGMEVKENGLNVEALNEVLPTLKEGEYSSRIDANGYAYWVYVEKIVGGQAKPLREVFAQIERDLKEQQFHRETLKFREELFRSGNFAPLDEMLEAVYHVAKSRYSVEADEVAGGDEANRESKGEDANEAMLEDYSK